MKRVLPSSPPKHRLAGVWCTRLFPINFPFASNTCTPSPALDQTRPSASTRIPSGPPLSILQKTSPPATVPSSRTSNDRINLGPPESAMYRIFSSGENASPLGLSKIFSVKRILSDLLLGSNRYTQFPSCSLVCPLGIP